MENDPENVTNGNDQMQLPPGFRFYPTDEELITNYLSKKVMNNHFSAVAITEVDMNRVEPWDLPWKAKVGENEWYFFCVKDKKYPNGLRTNRATASGYWKATGKDREIFRGKSLVGMRKTLVFHKGRAPRGVKSNWVSHEYRLEGEYSYDYHHTKSDWVIIKVFHKSCSGKKGGISGLTRPDHELVSSTRVKKPGELGSSHVSCFSSLVIPTDDEICDDFEACFKNPITPHASYQMGSFKIGSFGQFEICSASLDDKDTVLSSIENSSVVSNGKTWEKYKEKQDDRPSSSAGIHDFDFIWNF